MKFSKHDQFTDETQTEAHRANNARLIQVLLSELSKAITYHKTNIIIMPTDNL